MICPSAHDARLRSTTLAAALLATLLLVGCGAEDQLVVGTGQADGTASNDAQSGLSDGTAAADAAPDAADADADAAAAPDAAADADADAAADAAADTTTPGDTILPECTAADGCPAATNPCQVAACVQGSCTFVDASAGTVCEDGDACTEGDICDGGSCAAGSATACDDGDACTVDGCDPAKGCTHAQLTTPCDDGKLCTTDSCDPKVGCVFAPNALSCDDGEVCTTGDACKDGACAPGAAVACNDGNPCTDDSCAPGTGCVSLPNAASCTDNNACTAGDLCNAGNCTPGAAVVCADENPCTADSCDPELGCVQTPLGGPGAPAAPCDDGDACTTADACVAGACVGGGAPNCDDGNPCTTDGCDGATGCGHAKLTDSSDKPAPCDDGSACTSGDACEQGVCLPGALTDCDDGNPCTTDACKPASGCVHTANQLPCGDNDLCTGGDACKDGACVAGAAISCDDGNPCTTDACDAAKGCTHAANTAPCDDGNACSEGDACAGGGCKPGKAKSCDDGNACTSDACDASLGCKSSDNALPCSDGDACTSGDACKGGACAAGAAVACDDGNPCTTDACDAGKGCVATPSTDACDDGNVCTAGDACKDAACLPGAVTDCDDDNACTTDSCDAKAGCQHKANALPCDDGDVCTVGDTCTGGGCSSGKAQACDDGNACTDDACDPKLGCQATPNTAPCDDGSACTTGDACSGGSCKGGASKDCADANACTVDSCDAAKGCLHVAPPGFDDCGGVCTALASDAKNCGACGKACAAGSLCISSQCVAIVCVPGSKGSCYGGPSGTEGVGMCKAGERTCNSSGTAWLDGCVGEVQPAAEENCETPGDDDCDGVANQASLCGPAESRFNIAPNCGSYCYYDEPHNVTLSGSPSDNSKVGTYAVGQLVDGKKGGDNWSSNLGSGNAYEWVGWSSGTPEISFRFPKQRAFAAVIVGLNNYVSGGVHQPSAIEVESSVDGVSFSKAQAFSLAAKTLPKIPDGKRGDVKLQLSLPEGRFLRLRFTRVSWTFVDEVVFE